MALTIGEVTVDEDGDATGSGLAFAIFEGVLQAAGEDEKKAVAASMKPFCEGLAEAIIDHFKNNGEIKVVVTTADGALQRTPDPNNPNTDTQGPSADRTVTGTIE